jgi:SAM-dependent methyltransferase
MSRVGEQCQPPDLTEIKEHQQKAWASGDYAMFGTALLIISELLCEAVALRPGQKVLDVATGSGNTALAAARRYGEVTGIDYVPALLERGRERAAAERLEVTFQNGDAENVPFPEASFDAVLSTVGVMFAPDQEKAAGELLRVCRPGGRIGLANWTPDSFAAEMPRVFARYVPPPDGLLSPSRWARKSMFGSYSVMGWEISGPPGAASCSATARSGTTWRCYRPTSVPRGGPSSRWRRRSGRAWRVISRTS